MIKILLTITLALSGLGGWWVKQDQLTAENIIAQINYVRKSNFIGELKPLSQLMGSASQKLNDLCAFGYFDHNREGRSWDQFFATKPEAIGENLARDYFTPHEVVQAWQRSNLHRDNLLSWHFKQVGIAIGQCNGATYVVAHFSS